MESIDAIVKFLTFDRQKCGSGHVANSVGGLAVVLGLIAGSDAREFQNRLSIVVGRHVVRGVVDVDVVLEPLDGGQRITLDLADQLVLAAFSGVRG